MELTESINTINRQLAELFGIDTDSRRPIFRVVWCNDEYEVRVGLWTDHDKNGIKIREINEARRVPKYITKKDRYVLEKLVIVPDINAKELADTKVSYEPLWFFENADDHSYLPPKMEVCQFVIKNVLEAMHRPKGYKRYIEEQASQFAFLGGDSKAERMKKIKEELFGNETPITDALMAQRGVGYTTSKILKPEIILTDK